MALRAYCYVRVSTAMQEDAKSLLYQREKCLDFCEAKGYEVIKIIEDVESGAKDDRKGFVMLKQDVQKKSFDVLVVYETSRISRKNTTMLNFVNELSKNSILFSAVSQQEIDTTTATGMLFFGIQSSLAEYERKQIASRVKTSKYQRAKGGRWQGGNTPFGYRKENDEFFVVEEDSQKVKEIFEYFLKTQSISGTAKYFGKNPASLRWILRNPFYLGKIGYRRSERDSNTGILSRYKDYNNVFDGHHEAIITEEIFKSVQEIIDKKQRVVYSDFKFLFSGILRCTCGGKMYSSRNSSRNSTYSCKTCRKSIEYKKTENAIIEELLNMDEIKELDSVDLDTDKEKLLEKISFNEGMLSKYSEERKRLGISFTKGYLEEKDVELEMLRINSSQEIVEEEIKNLKSRLSSEFNGDNYSSSVRLLKEVVENMNDTDRNDIHSVFKLLIKQVVIVSRSPLKFEIYL